MRRSTSRIGKLPREVLEEVNEKLYAGWGYPLVRKWLFEEVAEEDVPALGLVKGEKFSLVWLRAAKSAGNAGNFCELALGTWFRARHPQWVREKILRGESMRVVRRAGVLTREVVGLGSDETVARQPLTRTLSPKGRGDAAPAGDAEQPNSGKAGGPPTPLSDEVSIAGGDVLVRSILIDAISSVEEGGKDRREIAQLANAWARLNAGKMEEEKLKLKTEDSRKAAFDEIGRDVRGNPEAMELFKKLCEVMGRSDGKRGAE